MSNISGDGPESLLTKIKYETAKTEVSTVSEYETKREQKLWSEGIIMHPSSQDMEDKNDFIFLQVFSSLTNCYIEEEISKGS